MHEKSIELLNRAVGDELAAVHQYMYLHFHLDDQGYDLLSALFRRTAIQEMGHVELLAERILFLKGEVAMKASGDVTQVHDVAGALEMGRKMEEGSVRITTCGPTSVRPLPTPRRRRSSSSWWRKKKSTTISSTTNSTRSSSLAIAIWPCSRSSAARAWLHPQPRRLEVRAAGAEVRRRRLTGNGRLPAQSGLPQKCQRTLSARRSMPTAERDSAS